MTTPNDESIARSAMLDFADAPEGIGLPASWRGLTRSQAELTLNKLCANPVFREKAVQSGSPASEARLYLIGKKNGVDIPDDQLRRAAMGRAPGDSLEEE